MRLVAPEDRTRCRPFRLTGSDSERGPRLGGRAPAGTYALKDCAVYIATVSLAVEPDLELSVFVQGEIWGAMNRGLFSDDRIVAVAHAPCARRSDEKWASGLSGHRIVVGELVDDCEGDTPRADHKIGGRPYCIQEPAIEGAKILLDRGLVQLVQLDFPSSRDGAVHGSWPFADGMFNLLGAPPFDTFWWAFQK